MTSRAPACLTPRALIATLFFAASTIGISVMLPVTASAVNLPDGRVFEEVTPVHMNGGRALPDFVGAEGERAFYEDTNAFTGPSGGFIGATFEAQRTSTGWQSSELLPSASEYSDALGFGLITDVSGDLSKSLTPLADPFETGFIGEGQVRHDEALFMQELDGGSGGASAIKEINLTPKNEPVNYRSLIEAGMDSADFSHHYFAEPVGESKHPGPLGEEVELGQPSQHYEEVGVIGPVDSEGKGTQASECGQELGSTYVYGGVIKDVNGTVVGNAHTLFHAVSPDGSTVFFTALGCSLRGIEFEGEPGVGQNRGPFVSELMARINDSETIPISEPSLESCPGVFSGHFNFGCFKGDALFEGASTDASKVFFTSSQVEEVPGVTDATKNLYEAELGGSPKRVTSLVQVSGGDSSGEGARVQGVVRISDDGSHVYFVAQGVLTGTAGPEGLTAQNGADNLYVYSDGAIKFIGEVCSALNQSGSVSDPHCPGADSELWTGERDAHAAWAPPFGSPSADGHMLVFDTRAQLITKGPEADTDTATDVYEYDSQTGGLIRVSTGRNGFDDNGNDNNFDATISIPNYAADGASGYSGSDVYAANGEGGRPVSNDGSFVFFTTSEALEGDDVNEAPDVYEWHNGLVSLISDGLNPGRDSKHGAATANVFLGSSADGKDVFFVSPDTLVAEGGANPAIIYDARIGGGFPRAVVPPPCREDACQGTISPTPSFLSPSSALYNSGGNTTLTVSKPVVKPKPKKATKPKKKTKKKKKRKVKKAASGRGGK